MSIILTAIVALIFGGCIVAAVLSSRAALLRTQIASLDAELTSLRSTLAVAQQQLAAAQAETQQATSARHAAELESSRLSEKVAQQEQNFSEQRIQQETFAAEQLARVERQAREQQESVERQHAQQLELLREQHAKLMAQREQEFASRMEVERKQTQEKLDLLSGARVELTNQFKALASDILEEKSKRFTEQNQENLSQLLNPLSEKIKDFQQKVEDVYVKETEGRSALGEQVRLLMGLNQQLSDDTGRLTRALTTQSKAQGDLGEVILEKILESSGLRKGEEYETQSSYRNEDARNVRPDVIVRLPENKHLVIDSKVSLTAYSELVNAADEEARKQALTRHLASVRKHIAELAEKNYQSLHQLQSIDFVCMFVPVEGAFMAAINGDANLWNESYQRNVLLVSPSTLLFVVRTVAHLWRQEKQKQNVQEIVNRGAELYDKLVGFVEDLKDVGSRLDAAKKSYDGALNKFAQGKGNAIRQAEMLKELGVKPKKSLPADLVERSDDELPLLAESAEA